MNTRKIKILVASVIILAAGCKKPDQYSDIPVITFKSLTTMKDAYGYDKAEIVVSFTDGDGDIGYYSSGNGSPYDDTTSVYFHNYIIHRDSLHHGEWNLCAWGDSLLSGRMPYLTPTGNNKALKGDIAMDVFLPLHRTNDTIRYNIFIYDRALHKSNTVTTPALVVNTH